MPDLAPDETNQAKWLRVRERLRVEVGEDIFSSWFARLELENIGGDTVQMTVPTRFLRSWIQSHYAEKLLACWQSAMPEVVRIDVGMRSAVVRQATTIPIKPVEPRREAPRELRTETYDGRMSALAPPASGQHDALGGSPLDPRLTFEVIRGRPLQYTGAGCRTPGR